jgi:hypothetical protein
MPHAIDIGIHNGVYSIKFIVENYVPKMEAGFT